jgi:hypothetical protein
MRPGLRAQRLAGLLPFCGPQALRSQRRVAALALLKAAAAVCAQPRWKRAVFSRAPEGQSHFMSQLVQSLNYSRGGRRQGIDGNKVLALPELQQALQAQAELAFPLAPAVSVCLVAMAAGLPSVSLGEEEPLWSPLLEAAVAASVQTALGRTLRFSHSLSELAEDLLARALRPRGQEAWLSA